MVLLVSLWNFIPYIDNNREAYIYLRKRDDFDYSCGSMGR